MSTTTDQSKQYLLLAWKRDNRFRYLSPNAGERIEYNGELFHEHQADTPQELIMLSAQNGYKITGAELNDACESIAKTMIDDATPEQIKQAILPLMTAAKKAGIILDPESVDRTYRVSIKGVTEAAQAEPICEAANQMLEANMVEHRFTVDPTGSLFIEIPGLSTFALDDWVTLAKQQFTNLEFTVEEVY